MRAATTLSALVCLATSAGALFSLLLPSWREGYGTKFLEHDPHMFYVQTFEERSYGVLYVTGVYRWRWATLAAMTCDKYSDLYGIAVLQGLVETTGEHRACVQSPGAEGPCPANYANHMMERCREYTAMHVASQALVVLIIVAFVCTTLPLMLMLGGTLKGNRELIFMLLLFSDLCLLVGASYYVYRTDEGFKTLSASSSYPYPKLSSSYYFFLGCCLVHFKAVLLFGWTKVFSKWVSGGTRPQGWAPNATQVPPGQRALLAAQEGPGMAPPGPVPTGDAPALAAPPGPVPGGTAPAFGPPM